MRLDGRPVEPAWLAADSITRLVTIEPEEGGTPAGRTVVRVLADPEHLWIGVRCHDPDPAGRVAYSKARDVELDDEDHVLFVLDTFGDQRSGYVFAVNPLGSRLDGVVTAEGDDVNSEWDAIWEAATAVDDGGWSAEIRLPIRSIGFARGLGHWGFNVERRVQRLQETSRWSGARLDYEVFQTSRAGVLSDLPRFDLGIGLTVRPGVVADARRPVPGRAGGLLREPDGELSLDVTQRLGPNLGASLTFNTDFGETEADARQTNLSRFDILFPERRSFFLEGADVFGFGTGLDVESATLVPFFSRRIGLVVPEGEDEDAAVEAPLRAGAKVQGRLGETALGALIVATDRLDALEVPSARMGALRLRRNVLAESSVGVIGTFGDPIGRRDAWLGGADFIFRTAAFRGDKNLLAGAWGLGTGREGLTGDRGAFGARVAYPNDDLDLGLTWLRIGEAFDPSLGFVQRTGQAAHAAIEIKRRPEGGAIRRRAYAASAFAGLDADGAWESYALSLTPLDWVLESGDRVKAAVEAEGERPDESFDVFESPARLIEIAAGTYEWKRVALTAALAEKRPISGEVSVSTGGFYRGDLLSIEAALALRPASIITVELSGERNRATLPEGDFTQYLYAARTEVKFSPELQLTHFVQYDNESRSLGSASRLRWTFHPLGDLFVALNHHLDRVVETDRKQWRFASDQLIVKLQYAFRF